MISKTTKKNAKLAQGLCRAALSIMLFSGSLQAANPGEERAASVAKYGIKIPAPAPDRGDGEGAGPYQQLQIENVMLIDGLGSPPRGPVDISIVEDKIVSIRASRRSSQDTNSAVSGGIRRIDATGMTALPGFIDAHSHIGNPGQGLAGPVTPPEYVFKLWLAHGITTVREVGSGMGLAWTVDHAKRSEDGEIVAPRIIPYAMFPGSQIVGDKAARKWVRAVKKNGAQGVKLRGGTRQALVAVYDEAKKLGMGTASHHDQNGVYHVNALDSARAGLDSMEHWYGLPEALFTDKTIQDYPPEYNYADEQWRFAEAGRLWLQAAEPGSQHWQKVMAEMLALDFTLVPTFTIYEANRDVIRARDAEWHATYTLPALQKFFMPDPRLHGSYHFDWTTADEVAWGNNFKRWMQFVNEYKNRGGRVAAGSDAGFIFKLFGFAYIRELELLQEAGFHPLEVIQAATLNGAELIGMEEQIGSITPNKQADIVLVQGNPVANFKLLYGTGHMKLNRESGVLGRVGGVSYTIKSGIVYHAKELLADVAKMVAQAKSDKRN
ncbi:MAG: amidohydrolase family protein [Gammaproteobacteria bacterium]|nr:amidohydrolase family protein [Gammaproteobacteria bacterium]MBT6246703.1 amidohydrolase family protein [Gammaproteobacteria bacterium]